MSKRGLVVVVAIAVVNKNFLEISTSIALRVLLALIFPATVTVLAEQCEPALAASIDLTPHINGWGINKRNHRFIAESNAGISRGNVANLQV